MKKNIFLLAALFIASATFVACSSDDNIIDEPAQQGKYTISITAAKGDNGGLTRALSPNGSDIAVSWNEGEEVEVYQGTTYVGTLTSAASATSSTTLTGELNASFNPENMIGFYLHGANRVFTGQDGSLSHIGQYNDYGYANLFDPNQTGVGDAIKYTVTGSTVLGSISFSASNCILKFAFYQTDGTTPIYPKSLIIHDEANHIVTVNNSVTGNFQYDDMSIAVAANASSNTTNEVYVSMHDANTTNLTLFVEATDGKVYSYKVNGAKYFQAGNYYRIKVRLTQVHPFTVDTGGKKVLFAPGNLQYNASEATNKWRFARNQYDVIGSDNSNISDSYNGWIDLFGWGSWTGSSPNPTNASTTSSDYTWDSSDFTQESSLVDASQRSYNWRTLTSAEWKYVFDTRTVKGGTGSGYGYTLNATVESRMGIVLYPDDYTGVEYTGSEWASFEAVGCVFLPAAGLRSNGTSVSFVGSLGRYWSSTAYNASCYYMMFASSNVGQENLSTTRATGFSVRLVHEVN